MSQPPACDAKEEASAPVIEVIAAIGGQILECSCAFTPGQSTVAEVLEKSAILERMGAKSRQDLCYGSYGAPKVPTDPLGADDRLEIFERLPTDPTDRRRRLGLGEKRARQASKRAASGSGEAAAG